jgi:hypothetical protein
MGVPLVNVLLSNVTIVREESRKRWGTFSENFALKCDHS